MEDPSPLQLLPTLLLLLTPSPSQSHPDLHPLLSFKASSDPSGLSLPFWFPSSDPCSWPGVGCRSSRVARLLLPNLSLSGPIHTLTLLPHLRLLNLSHNHLSGSIPATILLLNRLRRLDLSHNLLAGTIPAELGFLPRLVTLRLERNILSGQIPRSLDSIHSLADFNISGNRLIGEIPISLSSYPLSSFAGNHRLCGKPLLHAQCTHLQSEKTDSTPQTGSSRGRSKLLLTIVAGSITLGLALVALTLLLVWLHVKRRAKNMNRGTETTNVEVEGVRRGGEERIAVFFEGCKRFKVDDLMRGSAEMLGRGAAATTYRVVREGEVGTGVVVKRVRRIDRVAVIGGGAVEGLLKEIGRLRHPNVVSLRAYCHSSEELLLVYDYLPNGSLHSLLHGKFTLSGRDMTLVCCGHFNQYVKGNYKL